LSFRQIRIKSPIAPVLHEPRPQATQETQILFGHCANILETRDKWLRVKGADGYEGWLNEGFTEPCDGDSAVDWGWDTRGELSLGCSMRDDRGVTIDLPLGAILSSGKCVNGRSMNLDKRREIFPSDANAVVAAATGFYQGTYYQWGGITPWGADCSGMVQTVYALHGVKLLRDAWQQATQGVLIEGGLGDLRPADLLFFSDREDGHITHVAMAISAKQLVHLALGRGGHCLESLVNPDEYVTQLLKNFRFARRIL
jgi:hypothetical protein